MPDFDEKAGFDVIKESMGLTDQDLAPEGDIEGEGDPAELVEHEGDDLPDSEFGESDEFEAPPQPRQIAPDRTPQPPTQRDPLRQNTLRFDPRASFRQDKKGNLVDARTGEIIARAGSEARIYQRVHKQATDYIQTATRNIQNQMATERGKLERAVEIGLGFEKALGEARQAMQRLNAFELSQDQLVEAAQYFKQAQTDPMGVLKNLLTRAHLSGIDISALGVPGAAFDPKGISDMVRREIQQAMNPVQQYTQSQLKAQEDQQVQSQYLRQAERQVNEFFGTTPEAVPYTEVFHAVLSQPQFQHMTLGAIWDKIQLHLMRNRVDPRRPPSRSQRQRLSGSPATQSRSLPNGQGMAPVGSDRTARGNAGPAHPSMSYDAIIREVLGNAR
jgi:hypothetical protein